MTLLYAFFIFAVLTSFLCSLLEAVILSVTPAYISVNLKQGRKSAQILNRLKRNMHRPLIAILTLNTIANTVGAAGVGAQVLKVYGDHLVAVASGVLTLTILIFSEIVPKTLGTTKWKQLAALCAYLIQGLIILTFPIVYILEGLVFLISGNRQNVVSRAELIESAEIGVTEGSLKKKESLIIRNLLMLEGIYVSDIMTPRSVITAFPADATVDLVMREHLPIRFSRMPVYSNQLDQIVGMVHRYRIMEAASKDHDSILVRELMTSIDSVSERTSVSQVLDMFILKNRHIFVALDDFGKVSGLVTLEDAVETLLGVEIVDELDSVTDMRKYALEMWKRRHSKRNITKKTAKEIT